MWAEYEESFLSWKQLLQYISIGMVKPADYNNNCSYPFVYQYTSILLPLVYNKDMIDIRNWLRDISENNYEMFSLFYPKSLFPTYVKFKFNDEEMAFLFKLTWS